MHPDQRFVEALVEHNNLILSELYKQNAHKVQAWICTNSGSQEDAADMMQEALITIARQARRPEGLTLTCPFSNYLMMVVRGKWFNELKRRKGVQVTIETFEGLTNNYDLIVLAEQAHMEDAKLSLFQSFFSKLPDGCQKLVQLSWTGLSMQEVAQKLNVSYGYARKRKSQCIALLMESIEN